MGSQASEVSEASSIAHLSKRSLVDDDFVCFPGEWLRREDHVTDHDTSWKPICKDGVCKPTWPVITRHCGGGSLRRALPEPSVQEHAKRKQMAHPYFRSGKKCEVSRRRQSKKAGKSSPSRLRARQTGERLMAASALEATNGDKQDSKGCALP